MAGTLFLIPTTLGDTPINQVLPAYNSEVIIPIKNFIVEDLRSARRFLKKVEQSINIDELTFLELNEHSRQNDLVAIKQMMDKKEDIGLLSDAGCPVIADPGADAIRIAHKNNYKVVPLSGPSSILMTLMASGFIGQNFAFNGYLPVKPNERSKAIKRLENRCASEGQTQLFMEAPYRNNKFLESLIATLHPETMLCSATDITLETEQIIMKPVKDWKKIKVDLHKRPTVFAISK